MTKEKEKESPNTGAIDLAIAGLLRDSHTKEFDELLFERRRKAIMVSIQWEKVRHAIMEEDDGFEPDSI